MISLLAFTARVMVGFVFAYAGLSKLLEPVENFQAILSNYALIPSFFEPMIARVLPWMEWIGGSFLILGYAPRKTSFLLACVSFTFFISLTANFVLRGSLIRDCGCFGARGLHLSSIQMLAIDVFNLMILTTLIFIKKFPFSVDQWLKKGVDHQSSTEEKHYQKMKKHSKK